MAGIGQGVEIKFMQFDLEREKNCGFDYIEIYDGKERNEERRITRFCGNQVINWLIANYLEIFFKMKKFNI